MPARKPPETFDQHVGVAIMNVARTRGLLQGDLAAHLGITERTFTRRMAGDPGFTVHELTSIAGRLEESPGTILQSALDAYGGITKVLSEGRGKTDPPRSDADVVDMLDRRSRDESKEVPPRRHAAHRGRKDQ